MPLSLIKRRFLLLAPIAASWAAALPGRGQAQPATGRVFVSNERDNTITVVDAASLEVVATVKVGERPRGILLSGDGRSLYVCASDSDRVEVMDLATLQARTPRASRSLPTGAGCTSPTRTTTW